MYIKRMYTFLHNKDYFIEQNGKYKFHECHSSFVAKIIKTLIRLLLTLLHPDQPKLYGILAGMGAIGLIESEIEPNGLHVSLFPTPCVLLT